MCKHYLLLLWAWLVCSLAGAATFPTTSTADNTVWYLIQFLNGENVLAAQGDGQQVTTAIPTGRDAQLWKLEGDATAGYTLISKTGLVLYVNSTAKQGMFYAAETPTGSQHMQIVATTNATYSDGFEIQPKENSAVSMNQWGGAGTGKKLGLWDKGDGNNPLIFVTLEEFKAQGTALPLIPYPASLTVTREGSLPMSTLTAITWPDEETRTVAEAFAGQLNRTSGLSLAVEPSEAERKAGAISLNTDASLGDEAYTLTVDEQGVAVTAAKPAGFFYALQTLKQLMPQAFWGQEADPEAAWALPYVSIADEPALGHRGFMLDIARHFFDKTEVKRVLDIMALYKFNRFHWHLTDDQGWRIEIPEYPRLTEVGSIRAGSFTNAGGATNFYDDTEYGRGMWYSLDDLREIVAYAKERHIEIIPEVDLPGHMVAAVTSYPEFSCDPSKTYSVRIDGGISQDVLNIGKDEVIDFLKCVLGHVAEVFPYKYVHIGGDECPTTQWSTNAECLERVRAEGLGGVNELQSWLVEQLGTFLKAEYGKDIVVWDELLSHWSSDNSVQPVIMAWNSINMSSAAADKGFSSIVVPYQSLYLDMMQVPVSQADVNEVYQGGWGDNYVNTVQTVYGVNPVAALSGREQYCLGVQGNMWTETCSSNEQLEYQLLPRLLALSETAWLPAAKKDWVSFYTRLQSHDEILDSLGYVYAKHYIEPADLTPTETWLAEAEQILEASVRGGAGYPAATYYDRLAEAVETVKSSCALDELPASDLLAALQAYKDAPIELPAAEKVYQLVSTATYYKQRYAGSTVYEKDGSASFHYTPQVEPEELWQFVPTGEGFVLKNCTSGNLVSLPAYNQKVVLGAEQSTVLRIDRATVPAGSYDYVPGAVTISAVEGYSATSTGNVKRLHGMSTGVVFAYDDPTLCYPGTWRLVEVTDFTAQLEGLCRKAERLIATSRPGEVGEPSAEALDYLQNSIVAPARAELLETETITRERYEEYNALYAAFLAMPRLSLMDGVSEECYYNLRNAYFTDYYAKANASTKQVVPQQLTTDDSFRWRFVKNADGSVTLYNKATGGKAYITSSAEDQTLQVGSTLLGRYKWTLMQVTTDVSNAGIAIVDPSGTYSWYVNPSAFSTVIMKPYDWGASVWTLEKLDDPYVTGIEEVESTEEKDVTWYDLSGRRVPALERGIYVSSAGKIIKK